MYSESYYNDLKAEEKAYFNWVKEQKLHILNMTDSTKKQQAWSLLFPKWKQDESYLENDSGVF